MKSRSVWFENGTEKARKQRNENSKRLIKSAILGNADILGRQKRFFVVKPRCQRGFSLLKGLEIHVDFRRYKIGIFPYK